MSFKKDKIAKTDPEEKPIEVLTVRLEDEYRLLRPPPQPQEIGPRLDKFPEVFVETRGPWFAKHCHPTKLVELKPGGTPAWVRHYPMAVEAWTGMAPHICHLLNQGILKACQLVWNTPLFPVKGHTPLTIGQSRT